MVGWWSKMASLLLRVYSSFHADEAIHKIEDGRTAFTASCPVDAEALTAFGASPSAFLLVVGYVVGRVVVPPARYYRCSRIVRDVG